MKHLNRIITTAIVFVFLLSCFAHAEEGLTAILNQGKLEVKWSPARVGECVLTVYRDDWPICVCRVEGASGQASIALSGSSKGLKVRLKTQGGCMTAKVGESGNPPTGKPTQPPVVTPPTATPRPTDPPVVTPPTATPRPTEPPAIAPPAATPRPTDPPQNTGSVREDLAAQVVDQVNAERAKNGLSTLRVDSELTRAACVRAREIVRSFSHTRPDGSQWSTVSGSAYGENIAKGQRTADKVMAAWLTSEGHRANILRSSYGSIGVCAIIVDGVTYWVQLFGK